SRSRTRSTRRSTSARATRSCGADRGPRSRWSLATRSATGTCHSAARSSPASAVPATPEALRAPLGALGVPLDEASADVRAVDLPSYPGGPRPSSVIALRGAGAIGRGEHVAWTEAAHVACRDRTLPRIACGRWELAAWSAVLATVADG